MITIVYSAKKRNLDFEKEISLQTGFPSVDILYYSLESFSESYNKALLEAKTDIVVFVREDIKIETADWGAKIVEDFTKTDFGILGIVGSTIVPMSGLVWEKEEPLVGRIWYEGRESKNEHRFSEIFKGKVIQVVTIDDAFFAISRAKVRANFDTIYKKDSFYDLDFCLANYELGVKIGVTFSLKVVKLSFNDQDKTWIENRKLFVSKHRNLPYRIKPEIIVNKVNFKLEKTPKVSMIIPLKNKPVELASSLEAIFDKCKYPNLDIFVVDTGSKPDHLKSIKDYIRGHSNTTLIEMHNDHIPGVYEEVIEKHISEETELLLFCDPEIILLNDAITRMVKVYIENPETCGTLGIRMHTKGNMIRHFGLMLFSTETNEGYELGLGFQGFQSAYKYKNKVIRNVLGCSKDFLMIPKKLYQEIGGFNKNYLHSLEDFELNVRSILQGKENYLVGCAVSYYCGQDVPKFLPADFMTLVNFINEHVDTITPYVGLVPAA